MRSFPETDIDPKEISRYIFMFIYSFLLFYAILLYFVFSNTLIF